MLAVEGKEGVRLLLGEGRRVDSQGSVVHPYWRFDYKYYPARELLWADAKGRPEMIGRHEAGCEQACIVRFSSRPVFNRSLHAATRS